MRISLVIDVNADGGTVSLYKAQRRLWSQNEHWAEFYARLALVGAVDDEYGWVGVDLVNQLASWRSVKLSSIGKIMCRQIDEKYSPNECVLDYKKKTGPWRLRLDESQVRLRPTTADVVEWLRHRERVDLPLELPTKWLVQVGRALIAFHVGDVELAESAAAGALKIDRREVFAHIAGFVLIRAAASRGRLVEKRVAVEEYLLEGMSRSCKDPWNIGPLGSNMKARLLALEALACTMHEAGDFGDHGAEYRDVEA
jgi:hypothetical protein